MFRVAGHLGKDVAEVAEWDTNHLQDWAAFYELEPFGVDWWFAFKLLHKVSNALRGSGSPVVTPAECLPVKPREQTAEEMLEALRGAFGGARGGQG